MNALTFDVNETLQRMSEESGIEQAIIRQKMDDAEKHLTHAANFLAMAFDNLGSLRAAGP